MSTFIEGGVTAARGFSAAGIHCGIRKNRSKKDLALIFSDRPAAAAAVYTRNLVKGAPLTVTKRHLENGTARAIVCNSGIANTCAADGIETAEEMCRLAAEALGIDVMDVLPASTGVIGPSLPLAPIAAAMPALAAALSETGSSEAAEAIMTTDTKVKTIAVEFDVDGTTCHIGGICKGSGMIHPNMGTMLCFITTDCAVSSEMIRKALLFNVKRTFNRVTVDGDTSTNDMCTVLANGMAGNAEITAEDPAYEAFREALQTVMQDLARKIAADGEGASKLMTCTVKGAKDEETAEVLAKSIAGSSLTKAAMFGSDANWGRVLCAMGYSGAAFNTEKVLVEFASKEGSIAVCEDGRGLDFDEALAKKILSQDEVEINVTLQEGSGSATCWGCDLTYDYVKINGDYRT